jgi:hypothetical protein
MIPANVIESYNEVTDYENSNAIEALSARNSSP